MFFAGQIAGIEGYIGNIATGLLAGINAAGYLIDQKQVVFPITTMLGSLCHYISNSDPKHFQPMKANYGILPQLTTKVRGKLNRASAFSERSISDLRKCILENQHLFKKLNNKEISR